MFKTKRKAHHEAIKKMLEIKENKKEKEMLNMITKKLFETLHDSLQSLAKIQTGSNQGLKVDQSSVSRNI